MPTETPYSDTISDPVAGQYTANTSHGLCIRFHTSPDTTSPPPSDLPPGSGPLWIQVWDRDSSRWLSLQRADHTFEFLRPGDIIACFKHGVNQSEPDEILLVVDYPVPPSNNSYELWGIKHVDVSKLKESGAFEAGLGERAN